MKYAPGVARLAPDATAGIYEWRVETNAGKQVEDAPELAPTETFKPWMALRW